MEANAKLKTHAAAVLARHEKKSMEEAKSIHARKKKVVDEIVQIHLGKKINLPFGVGSGKKKKTTLP